MRRLIRTWLTATVGALLVLWGTRGTAAQPQVPDATRPDSSAVATRDSLVGEWRVVSRPDQRITVTSAGEGEILFHSAARFMAHAYADSAGFRGIARLPDLGLPGSKRYSFAVMSVTRLEPTRLEVTFTSAADSSAAPGEVWEFVGAPGPGTLARAKRAETETSRPKIGVPIPMDVLPSPIERYAPAYPPAAMEQGIQGTVQVFLLVGNTGQIRDMRFANSIPALDAAAVAALERWRFQPATSRGTPIAVWLMIPIRFALH